VELSFFALLTFPSYITLFLRRVVPNHCTFVGQLKSPRYDLTGPENAEEEANACRWMSAGGRRPRPRPTEGGGGSGSGGLGCLPRL